MRIQHVAASARGPRHEGLGRPNEDAWAARRSPAGTVVAVADGMGSKPRAAVGARIACRAAVAAVELWWRTGDADPRALPPLVETLWRAWLGGVAPDDARSTCLVAGLSAGGALVLAGLGDGLGLCVPPHGDEVLVVTAERQGFANETDALGARASADAWRVATTPCVRAGTVVVLATDGVADDLLPERRADFAGHLVASLGRLPEPERSPALWRELHRWPTPGHIDDKTIALMWSEA